MNDTEQKSGRQLESHGVREGRKERLPRFLLLGVAGLLFGAIGTYVTLTAIAIPESTQPAAVTFEDSFPNPFDNVRLEAKAAFVYDTIRNKPLFALNEEAQLPLASLTKLMTALVAVEELPEGTSIAITNDALFQEGDSGFTLGERFSLRDLLSVTLVESSNDGAYALAAAAGGGDVAGFVDAMNKRAGELNMVQTYFLNPTGLDPSDRVSGGYGSARDIALLMEYLVEKQVTLIEPTRHAALQLYSETNGALNATNTNAAIGVIPGLIASKTGLTDLAGGNLAVVFDAGLNHPIVAVVLGSSEDGRFRDIRKLVDASLQAVQEHALVPEQSAVE